MNEWLERLAVKIVNGVGTMWCALVFAALALVALPSACSHGLLAIVSWVSQTFIQLVMLSIIMVGQRVQDDRAHSRHEEVKKHVEKHGKPVH